MFKRLTSSTPNNPVACTLTAKEDHSWLDVSENRSSLANDLLSTECLQLGVGPKSAGSVRSKSSVEAGQL